MYKTSETNIHDRHGTDIMQGNNETKLSGAARETQHEGSRGLSVPGVSSAAFLVLICFTLLAFLLYANSLENEFVFDDIPLIAKNHQIRQLGNIPELLGLGSLSSYYRPLRIVSYAIDYHFFKLNPQGYHISNILLHSITAWLVFLTLYSLSSNYTIALAASVLFLVHPVQTDSVTYLAGRRDILSSLFYLLGFYLFIRYRKKPTVFLLCAIFLSYALAVSSKEMAVTLPAICFVYDFLESYAALPETKTGARNHLLKKIAVCIQQQWQRRIFFYYNLLLGAAAFIYYKVAVMPPSLHPGYYGGTWARNFLTVSRIIMYYLKLMLFPIALNADYSYNAFPVTAHLLDFKAWASVLALCVIFWAGIKAFRYNRLLTFSLAWFFITLLPVCHIIPHHELMAEHYLYLPSIGLFFLAGISLYTWCWQKHRYIFFLVAGLLMVLFSMRTVDRNRDWENALTLWKKTVKTAPACARALSNLGVEYYKIGEYDRARENYIKSLILKPDFPDPYHNLGNMLADKKMFDPAIKCYQKAFSLCRPGAGKEILNSCGIACRSQGDLYAAKWLFSLASKLDPPYAEARNNLGTVFLAEGNYAQALDELSMAVKIDPEVPEYHNNLGTVFRKTGIPAKAEQEFREAIRRNPDFMEAHNNLGNILKDQGLYREAIDEFKRCIELKPDSAEVFTNLGIVYRKAEFTREAIDAFSRALELKPSLALPHFQLALIYLSSAKDDEKALFHLKKTLELDPSLPQAASISTKIEELEGN
jgi:protein O-mannosyl-transferase